MKYLIVAAILGALLFLLYLRLRPYINAARRVLGVFRQARAMSAGQATPDAVRRKRTDAEERLVRCASCGTWIPASRALTLRSTSSAFCSHACMERSAGAETTARAAGNQR
ncbi:MAG TPA: hypothetical protein VK363_16205 [Pyrinomonadaceae bacterium]|nr:hypothetical protein [Pyrinomonadaceae bacterium]